MKNLEVLISERVLQLRSWSRDLGLPDFDSKPDLFDLLALHDLPDLHDLHDFHAFLLVLQSLALVDLRRRYNFDPLNWCSIQSLSPGEDFRCACKAIIY